MAISWLKKRVKAGLPLGEFSRNVFSLAGGTALGQVITVLVSPVLTRLYTPEDFGALSVYASILGIVTVIASLRYEYAILIAEDDKAAANVVALCFTLLFGMTLLSWVGVQSLGSKIVTWTNVPGLKPYLWLIPLGMLGTGIYQILNYWVVRKRDFLRIARTRISRGVVRAAIQVGVGFVHSGPLGLLLGQLAGETAGTVSLGLAVWRKDRASFKAVTCREVRQVSIRYKRFPLFSSLGSLLDSLGLQIPTLLLAAFYGTQVVGWFAFSRRTIETPLNIVADSVTQVYTGEIAQFIRHNPKAIKPFFLKLAYRLVLIGVIPIIVACAVAPWLFSFVFGAVWETAGRYVQIMGPMFAVRFIVASLGILNILERQDLYFLWAGTRLVLVAGALLLAKVVGVSYIAAIGIYSLTMLLCYLFLLVLCWRAVLDRSE